MNSNRTQSKQTSVPIRTSKFRYGDFGTTIYQQCVLNDKQLRKSIGLQQDKKETDKMCIRYVDMYLKYSRLIK